MWNRPNKSDSLQKWSQLDTVLNWGLESPHNPQAGRRRAGAALWRAAKAERPALYVSHFQNPVAAEVTRLISHGNQSLLTSAATILKEPHVARTFLSAGSGDFPVARRSRPRLSDQEQCQVAPPRSHRYNSHNGRGREGRLLAGKQPEELKPKKAAAFRGNLCAIQTRCFIHADNDCPGRNCSPTTPAMWAGR
jgi:hypothetical protein